MMSSYDVRAESPTINERQTTYIPKEEQHIKLKNINFVLRTDISVDSSIYINSIRIIFKPITYLIFKLFINFSYVISSSKTKSSTPTSTSIIRLFFSFFEHVHRIDKQVVLHKLSTGKVYDTL